MVTLPPHWKIRQIDPLPPGKSDPFRGGGGGGNAYFLDRTLAFAKMLILESLKVYTKV